MTEPETVFGEIKNNRGIRRFLLRGLWLTKISLDVGWLSLAHNMLKKAAVDAKTRGLSANSPRSSLDFLRILPFSCVSVKSSTPGQSVSSLRE